MENMVLQNIFSLLLLGLTVYSLFRFKRWLLRLSADRSQRTLRRQFILSKCKQDFC